MLQRLNHVAIVVPDLSIATALYKETLGSQVSAPVDLPEHGVTVVFVTLDNTKIELLHPLGDNSPIQHFLENNPNGGMHHLCFEVKDVNAAQKKVQEQGLRVLPSSKNSNPVKIGAHGKPVIFLHPKDTLGCLIELENC